MSDIPDNVRHFLDIWDRVATEIDLSEYTMDNDADLGKIDRIDWGLSIGQNARGKDCNGCQVIVQKTPFGHIVFGRAVMVYQDIDDPETVHFKIVAPKELQTLGCHNVGIGGVLPHQQDQIFGGENLASWGSRVEDTLVQVRAKVQAQQESDRPIDAFLNDWLNAHHVYENFLDDESHDGTYSKINALEFDLEDGETLAATDSRGRKVLVQETPYGKIVAYLLYQDETASNNQVMGGGEPALCRLLGIYSAFSKERYGQLFNPYDSNMNIGARWREAIKELDIVQL